MIYGENLDTGEKGLFFSIGEFLDYRREGWSATEQINVVADRMIEEEKCELTSAS